MLPLKSVSFTSPIPFAGTGLGSATEAMGLAITLIPAIRCVRLEVVKPGSRHVGNRILVPLEMVTKMEETDPDTHGYEPILPPTLEPQTCDFGGTGNDVDPSNLFQY
jgi:hypothetical protein